MAKVDDLLQSGTKQIVLAVVARLAHGCPPDSESRRRRNHEPPQSGIPKRKKTATHTRLSCKIEYLLRSNHGHSSIASEFFTGDGGESHAYGGRRRGARYGESLTTNWQKSPAAARPAASYAMACGKTQKPADASKR